MNKKQKAIAHQEKVKAFLKKLEERTAKAMLVPLTYAEWLEQGRCNLDLDVLGNPLQNVNPDDWDFYCKMDENMRIVSYGRCLKSVQ